MRTLARTVGLTLAAVLCVCSSHLPSVTSAEKDKGAKPDEQKMTKIETKCAAGMCANGVNFAKELNLGFPCLTTLGARIETARQQADPVGLAAAARELTAAEKACGKHAAITGEALTREAIDLAKLRAEPAEMKAVASIAGPAGKELMGATAKAEEFRAKQKADRDSGVATRGVRGVVHVDSRWGGYIRVYINGRDVGSMGPYGDIYPYVSDNPWEVTMLYAVGDDGRTWRREVPGSYGRYHWILNP